MSNDCFWERIHDLSTLEKRLASAGISLIVKGFENTDSILIHRSCTSSHSSRTSQIVFSFSNQLFTSEKYYNTIIYYEICEIIIYSKKKLKFFF